MIDQVQEWINQAPAWLPLALAVLATVAVVQLHRLWRQAGLSPTILKSVLVAAVILAVAGASPGLVPAIATELGDAAWQLQAIGYVAAALALIVSLVEAQKLRRDQGGVAGSGNYDPTIADDVSNYDSGTGHQAGFYSGGGGAGNGGPAWPDEDSAAVIAGLQTEWNVSGGLQPPRRDTVQLKPSARRTQLAWLAALSGPHMGQTWVLADETHLGQGHTDQCDIVLMDATVSRGHHALIRLQDDGRFMLADLASSNGTHVNGDRVERHTLADKDRITIGTSELVFVQADLRPVKRGPVQGGRS